MTLFIIMITFTNLLYLMHVHYTYKNEDSYENTIWRYVFVYTIANILFMGWINISTDIVFFYLLWEANNICGYLLIIIHLHSSKEFKGLMYYYFLSCTASILFIISLFIKTSNYTIAYYIINIALMIKLRIYPFSEITAYLYTLVDHMSFLAMSFLFSLQNFIILIIFNSRFPLHIIDDKHKNQLEGNKPKAVFPRSEYKLHRVDPGTEDYETIINEMTDINIQRCLLIDPEWFLKKDWENKTVQEKAHQYISQTIEWCLNWVKVRWVGLHNYPTHFREYSFSKITSETMRLKAIEEYESLIGSGA